MPPVQVVISLVGSELIYFELNAGGQLLEVERKDGLSDVTCLAIAQVPALLSAVSWWSLGLARGVCS